MKKTRKPLPIKLSQFRIDLLSVMPPMSHWPLKPEKFAPEYSEVYRFICDRLRVELDVAPAILKAAHAVKALTYDRDTGMWRGSKYTQWVEMMVARRKRRNGSFVGSPEIEHLRNLLNINDGKGQNGCDPKPKTLLGKQ